MDPGELTATDAARITAALRDAAIDESYLAFVARHVDVDDASWRWCCGSQCDPCVAELGRIVDLARRWLGHAGGKPPNG